MVTMACPCLLTDDRKATGWTSIKGEIWYTACTKLHLASPFKGPRIQFPAKMPGLDEYPKEREILGDKWPQVWAWCSGLLRFKSLRTIFPLLQRKRVGSDSYKVNLFLQMAAGWFLSPELNNASRECASLQLGSTSPPKAFSHPGSIPG
jgi:hypothetical protein